MKSIIQACHLFLKQLTWTQVGLSTMTILLTIMTWLDMGTSPLYHGDEFIKAVNEVRAHEAGVIFNPNGPITIAKGDAELMFGMTFWALFSSFLFLYIALGRMFVHKDDTSPVSLFSKMQIYWGNVGWVTKIGLGVVVALSALLFGDVFMTGPTTMTSALHESRPLLQAIFANAGFFLSPNDARMWTTIILLITLGIVQEFGPSRMGVLFGGIALLWFATCWYIGLTWLDLGVCWRGITNGEAIKLLFDPRTIGLVGGIKGALLIAVFFCDTGAEAIRYDASVVLIRNMKRSIPFLFLTLCVIYGGISNWISRHIGFDLQGKKLFFLLFKGDFFEGWAQFIAVIASCLVHQVVVVALFALVTMLITLRLFPDIKRDGKYAQNGHQLYIRLINIILTIGCCAVVYIMKIPENMVLYYGTGINISMCIVGLVIQALFFGGIKAEWNTITKLKILEFVITQFIILLFILLSIHFLSANSNKFADAKPILISALVLGLFMIMWYNSHELKASMIGYRKIEKNRIPLKEVGKDIVYLLNTIPEMIKQEKLQRWALTHMGRHGLKGLLNILSYHFDAHHAKFDNGVNLSDTKIEEIDIQILHYTIGYKQEWKWDVVEKIYNNHVFVVANIRFRWSTIANELKKLRFFNALTMLNYNVIAGFQQTQISRFNIPANRIEITTWYI